MVFLPKAIAGNKFVVIAIASAVIVAAIAIAVSMPKEAPRYDRFGVREIYPAAASGRAWHLGSNITDGVFVPSPAATEFASQPGGAWLVNSETTSENTGLRMYVMPPEGWHNVEMTGYVKLRSFSFDEEFAWAVRSGQHADGNPCDGTAYYGAISFSGDAWFQKEVLHAEGGYTDKRRGDISVGSLLDRWVGIKMIAYNVNGGVKLELWVDEKNDNSWSKVAETVDSGGWAAETGGCGRSADHIHSEPRPRVTFRVDNATFEFKNFSVREISAS